MCPVWARSALEFITGLRAGQRHRAMTMNGTKTTIVASDQSDRVARIALVVLSAACAVCALGPQVIGDADRKKSLHELAAFRLSMEKLSKAATAGKILEKLAETDPSLKGVAQFDKRKSPQSIDEAVNRIDGHPRARTAIQSAGLSTRDYVLTMYCFAQSTLALFLKEDGGEKHDPSGASEENVAFVKNHLKEINRLFSDQP